MKLPYEIRPSIFFAGFLNVSLESSYMDDLKQRTGTKMCAQNELWLLQEFKFQPGEHIPAPVWAGHVRNSASSRSVVKPKPTIMNLAP